MYFMVKSCIHTVRQPEPNQNMPYLSLYHRPVRIPQNSVTFPWKRRNSAEMGKFRGSAQNSVFRGKVWSLLLCLVHKCVCDCCIDTMGFCCLFCISDWWTFFACEVLHLLVVNVNQVISDYICPFELACVSFKFSVNYFCQEIQLHLFLANSRITGEEIGSLNVHYRCGVILQVLCSVLVFFCD